MADVIILISPTGKLLYISPNVKKFGGYDHEDELGNDMSKYFEKDTFSTGDHACDVGCL